MYAIEPTLTLAVPRSRDEGTLFWGGLHVDLAHNDRRGAPGGVASDGGERHAAVAAEVSGGSDDCKPLDCKRGDGKPLGSRRSLVCADSAFAFTSRERLFE